MSLGARLRSLRLKRSESLQDVASAIDISKTHVWELEKGLSRNPSVELLTKFADHFKVTISSLVGEELHDEMDDNLLRMFRQVSQLTEQDRETIDQMVQVFRNRRKAKRDDPD